MSSPMSDNKSLSELTHSSLSEALATDPEQDGNATVRRQIINRFESWLDDVLATEEPPAGIDLEILSQLQSDVKPFKDGLENDRGDMYALWSALTALTQETKLQGRAFKQLHEQIPPMDDLEKSLSATLDSHQEALVASESASQDMKTLLNEQREKIEMSARQKERAESLDLLIDLRDRLVRGLSLAKKHSCQPAGQVKLNWLTRIASRFRAQSVNSVETVQANETIEALIKGYQLTLVRLDSALEQFDVREIDCIGRAFDPQCMTAVDVEETLEQPDGTAVEVYRAGYKWNGSVFRAAQVKVTRRPEDKK